jgi:hypothetical protein
VLVDGMHNTYLFIFTYFIFNNATSSPEYVASNGRIIYLMMDWKGCGRKLSLPNFIVPSWYLPGRTEGNYEKLTALF